MNTTKKRRGIFVGVMAALYEVISVTYIYSYHSSDIFKSLSSLEGGSLYPQFSYFTYISSLIFIKLQIIRKKNKYIFGFKIHLGVLVQSLEWI